MRIMRIFEMKAINYILIFILSLFFTMPVFSQENSYGLGFQSHETVQEKRTSLDLFQDKPFEPNDSFSLSFDLSFFKGRKIYFGYIFRIIKDETENIDFIYDEQGPSDKHFRIIIGSSLTSISFDLDSNRRFNKWNNIKIGFDLVHKKIRLQIEKKVYEQGINDLNMNSSFRIFFGTNQFQRFKVTDVPPMKVRNITISNNQKPERNWPLNERDGLIAHENLLGLNATITNPIWIKNDHFEWKALRSFTVKGNASIAFNPSDEKLYIAGSDSLYAIGINSSDQRNIVKPAKQITLIGNQSLFADGKLFNIYPDQQFVGQYNFTDFKWNSTYKVEPTTSFWHFNKAYSEIDSSLYFLNGYGQLQYKNKVFKFNIPSRQWSEVKTTGDFLTPRYLAATGINKAGDSLYILGGYGSTSGQQILSPKSLYDLILYNLKTGQLKKLFELQPGKEDFVFANSLVLDEKEKTYYGLIFPNYEYNSNLQLIKGNLNNATYELLGSKIPFAFHDITSFADLYYAPESKLFVAVTSQYTEGNTIDNTTTIHIYTLAAPPVKGNDDGNIAASEGKLTTKIIYLIIGLILSVAIVIFMIFRKKIIGLVHKKSETIATINSTVDTKVNKSGEGMKSLTVDADSPIVQQAIGSHVAEFPSNRLSIHLFGELQIFDKQGTDITRLFTPLIKELFLVILLYSIRKGRGISSDRLNEIFWFDKSAKSARNNRSVNIAKLKTILDSLEFCQISKDTGYWKIEIDYNTIYVDFYKYLLLVNDKKKLTKKDIEDLSAITQRGPFLANIEHSWLDDFKSEVSNEIIDTYLHYASTLNIAEDAEFIIKITNYISYFDSVNEDAMIIRCKALYCLGKHSLAKTAFENFTREYRNIYGEDFGKDFNVILE